MKKEDFVSLECAKLLKEKGYDEPCTNGYSLTDNEYGVMDDYRNEYDRILSIPTLYEAQKWLRMEHNIHIEVSCINRQKWYCDIVWTHEDHFTYLSDTDFSSTYESALNAGIIEALK